VVGTNIEPFQVEYDGVDFTLTQLTFEERDFDGLPDELAVDERPTSLGILHYYNLRNQGWSDKNILIFAGRTDIAPEALCSTVLSGNFNAGTDKDFPSNADIMYLGFTTDNDGNPTFEREQITDNHLVGNTPAPKGHFILNPFHKDYNEALGCDGVGEQIFPVRPEAVAFHNGKVFFTRQVVQNLPNGIYYSRTLVREELVSQVRSEADPTAEEINDLVATDGGFITAPGIGEIYTLAEMGNGVVVGASNGVWYLSGADVDSGFSAVSNRLTKISDSGMLSADSYIDAGSSAYYWGIEGIMNITIGELGQPTVSNLTERTIQTFYISISAESRRQARGVYIPEQKKVYWGYADASQSEISETGDINKILVLDLNIGGFYPYTLSTDENFPEVVGFTNVKTLADDSGLEAITTTTDEAIF